MKRAAIKKIMAQIRELSADVPPDYFWDAAMRCKEPVIALKGGGFIISFDDSSIHLYQIGDNVQCLVEESEVPPYGAKLGHQHSARLLFTTTLDRLLKS